MNHTIKSLVILFFLSTLSGCFSLDPPEGEYDVGSVRIDLTDNERLEYYTPNPTDSRRVTTHIWYPSEPHGNAPRTTLMFRVVPKFVHSKRNAAFNPNLTGPLPVVVMGHAIPSTSNSSEHLAEHLAANGYIVVGIDHVYYGALPTFNDVSLLDSGLNFIQTSLKFGKRDVDMINRYFDIWVEDCHFVLDKLAEINNDPESMFYGKMDLDKVAYAGHSGGGTSGLQCGEENQSINAVVILDGEFFGSVTEDGTDIPFMFLKAEEGSAIERGDSGTTAAAQVFENSSDFVLREMSSSGHGDFSDWIKILNPDGEPGSSRKLQIINEVTLSFIEHYLQDHVEEIYDETQLESYPELKIVSDRSMR